MNPNETLTSLVIEGPNLLGTHRTDCLTISNPTFLPNVTYLDVPLSSICPATFSTTRRAAPPPSFTACALWRLRTTCQGCPEWLWGDMPQQNPLVALQFRCLFGAIRRMSELTNAARLMFAPEDGWMVEIVVQCPESCRLRSGWCIRPLRV